MLLCFFYFDAIESIVVSSLRDPQAYVVRVVDRSGAAQIIRTRMAARWVSNRCSTGQFICVRSRARQSESVEAGEGRVWTGIRDASLVLRFVDAVTNPAGCIFLILRTLFSFSPSQLIDVSSVIVSAVQSDGRCA